MRRILFDPGSRPWNIRLGTEGGRERVIFLTQRWGFYLSVKALGWRLRIRGYSKIIGHPKPHVWIGRA